MRKGKTIETIVNSSSIKSKLKLHFSSRYDPEDITKYTERLLKKDKSIEKITADIMGAEIGQEKSPFELILDVKDNTYNESYVIMYKDMDAYNIMKELGAYCSKNGIKACGNLKKAKILILPDINELKQKIKLLIGKRVMAYIDTKNTYAVKDELIGLSVIN